MDLIGSTEQAAIDEEDDADARHLLMTVRPVRQPGKRAGRVSCAGRH